MTKMNHEKQINNTKHHTMKSMSLYDLQIYVYSE